MAIYPLMYQVPLQIEAESAALSASEDHLTQANEALGSHLANELCIISLEAVDLAFKFIKSLSYCHTMEGYRRHATNAQALKP